MIYNNTNRFHRQVSIHPTTNAGMPKKFEKFCTTTNEEIPSKRFRNLDRVRDSAEREGRSVLVSAEFLDTRPKQMEAEEIMSHLYLLILAAIVAIIMELLWMTLALVVVLGLHECWWVYDVPSVQICGRHRG